MLVSIRRYYISSGVERDLMLNFRYVKRMEATEEHEMKPRTRIVMEGAHGEGDDIIYTDELISSIKGKITKARNDYLRIVSKRDA